MSEPEFIVDPDTGDVYEPHEAAAMREALCFELVKIEEAMARRPEVLRQLAFLLTREQPWTGAGGYAVALKPARTPPGRVIPDEIERHREALAPLGLGPREATKVVVDYPRVGELTTAAARAALARVGLSPEGLIHRADPGPDQVVVIAPEHAEVPR